MANKPIDEYMVDKCKDIYLLVPMDLDYICRFRQFHITDERNGARVLWPRVSICSLVNRQSYGAPGLGRGIRVTHICVG
jgi:hypothetical protein